MADKVFKIDFLTPSSQVDVPKSAPDTRFSRVVLRQYRKQLANTKSKDLESGVIVAESDTDEYLAELAVKQVLRQRKHTRILLILGAILVLAIALGIYTQLGFDLMRELHATE